MVGGPARTGERTRGVVRDATGRAGADHRASGLLLRLRRRSLHRDQPAAAAASLGRGYPSSGRRGERRSTIVTRHSGVLLPLFAAPSTSSWGIGELADIGPLSIWLASAGLDRLMLLPLGTMEAGE